jgi:cyclopropane fatty-acyl-phospholipid synthase-like methyltransferase
MYNFTTHLSYLGEDKIKILVYRCGMGEHVYSLAKKYPNWTVVGYDNSEIVSKNIGYYNDKYGEPEPSNVKFLSDWEETQKNFYDFILCHRSFDNMPGKQIELLLNEMYKITTKVVVIARELTIDRENTWGMIANSKFYKPQEFYRNHERVDFSLSTNMEEVSMGIFSGDSNGT